jgi:TolB-like protein/DNA-binding winged helix-turn-helix (wHTH) protein
MPLEKSAPEFVLNLNSFQLIRSGRPLKLEKTPMDLLTLLVRRRGALVSREEIVRTMWGDAVHVDVDAGINTAIRKIRLALDDNPASPRYLETAVGKGYRFIGPIDIIETVARTDVDSVQIPVVGGGRSGKWVGAALAVVGLAAIILLAISATHRNTASASGDHSGRQVIAVVPLQNLSADPGQDYFVDGLTDEIITQLGQLNPAQLGVVKYRLSGTRQQTRPVGGDLGQAPGLQYLLEGSMQRQQEQARISVRLVRMADQTTLWTDRFDRQVGDVFSLQSEIAQRIGRELQVRVLGHASRKPASPEVVEAYLHGRFELNQPDIRDAARVYFERAIALDPLYVPAYAGLADFYRLRAVRDDEGSQQAWQQSDKYANQALSLDADSVETHIALAYIKLGRDWDWPAVREHALRALQLNPSSPEAHTLYARYLRIAGNLAEDLNQRKQALALDPFRADLAEQLTVEYFLARDYQSAVASRAGNWKSIPTIPTPTSVSAES